MYLSKFLLVRVLRKTFEIANKIFLNDTKFLTPTELLVILHNHFCSPLTEAFLLYESVTYRRINETFLQILPYIYIQSSSLKCSDI